jgi:hypothetical protein
MPAGGMPLSLCLSTGLIHRRCCQGADKACASLTSPSPMLARSADIAAARHALRKGRMFPNWNSVSKATSPSAQRAEVPRGGGLAMEKRLAGTKRDRTPEERMPDKRVAGQPSCWRKPHAGAADRIVPSCHARAAFAPKCSRSFASRCRSWWKAPGRCLRLWWCRRARICG